MHPMRNQFGKSLCWAIGLAAIAAYAQAQTITTSVATLTFQYQIGAATLPAAQTVQVVSAPVGAAFTVTVTGAPFNAAWLLVSASSGKAPAPLKVQVNPTGLAAGSYKGTITIAGVATKTVQVTVLISNPPSTLSASPTALTFNYTVGKPIPDPSLASVFILSSNG